MKASIKIDLKLCIMGLKVVWGFSFFFFFFDNGAFGKCALEINVLFRTRKKKRKKKEQATVKAIWRSISFHLTTWTQRGEAGKFMSTSQHCPGTSQILLRLIWEHLKTGVIIHWVASNRAASLAKCHPNSFWLAAVMMTLPWWTPTAWVQAEEGL